MQSDISYLTMVAILVLTGLFFIHTFFSYYMPGNDHGSYEDPFNTWAMFMNSRNIQIAL